MLCLGIMSLIMLLNLSEQFPIAVMALGLTQLQSPCPPLFEYLSVFQNNTDTQRKKVRLKDETGFYLENCS